MSITKSDVLQELTAALLDQNFVADEQESIKTYQEMVASYVRIEQCVGVLSDFQANCSYIYSGSFGQIFGLTTENTVIDSAFEEDIFSKIHPDDIIERHVLELNYFQFQKSIEQKERSRYSTFSRIRVQNSDGSYSYINHRTIYVKSLPNGSVWLALCLYAASTDLIPSKGIDGKIIDVQTGEVIAHEKYVNSAKNLLSQRELEILTLVAKGLGSKQIAEELHIAVHTVYRHRQNIINKMKVANTAEAVKTAVVMGIVSL
ncbi:regulatory protein, luxR family [Flavobacterium flevense]|uniref:Helix-turn-helix transcriptional regulator n=1 Tax=Flavobacterium flevense TaxID=983 RepID=A0A4Y4B2P3_9FLAO|nr:helix-turn-helix transcriptional regulator [Flavobacterium flevense]GEC73839.1 helix-turn-helix transcriptional regulator [Flavobacterium flevense]SHM12915.1 regulatory protein, luxR family [Flavobacterium flevense]